MYIHTYVYTRRYMRRTILSILKCRNDISSYQSVHYFSFKVPLGCSYVGHPVPHHIHCSSVASVTPAPYTLTNTSPFFLTFKSFSCSCSSLLSHCSCSSCSIALAAASLSTSSCDVNCRTFSSSLVSFSARTSLSPSTRSYFVFNFSS